MSEIDKVSEYISMVTTTFYNPDIESDRIRLGLADKTMMDARERGMEVVCVDGGSPYEFLRKLENYGVRIFMQEQKGMAHARRQSFREAINLGKEVIACTEPEKLGYIQYISKTALPILEGQTDIVVPSRVSLNSYPIFQQYAVRFADTVTTHRWTNLNHYAFPLSPLLAVATIYGLRSFQNRFGKLALWTTVLLISVLSQNFFSHGPINSLFKPDFFQVTYWEKDAHELVKQVPPDVVIASQNSLLPHLAHRPKYYLLPEIGNADFIAVDLANGPNKYSPLNYTTFNDLIENLLVTNQYKIRWRRRDSLLLERVN